MRIETDSFGMFPMKKYPCNFFAKKLFALYVEKRTFIIYITFSVAFHFLIWYDETAKQNFIFFTADVCILPFGKNTGSVLIHAFCCD